VDFRDGVPLEPLVFELHLTFIAVTKRGGCRHIIELLCRLVSCSRFLSHYQVFRTACLCLLHVLKAAIRR